ncbi:hypothetical protein U1Q18_032282 [Sarracenia purpurea var. burkii]
MAVKNVGRGGRPGQRATTKEAMKGTIESVTSGDEFDARQRTTVSEATEVTIGSATSSELDDWICNRGDDRIYNFRRTPHLPAAADLDPLLSDDRICKFHTFRQRRILTPC